MAQEATTPAAPLAGGKSVTSGSVGEEAENCVLSKGQCLNILPLVPDKDVSQSWCQSAIVLIHSHSGPLGKKIQKAQ